MMETDGLKFFYIVLNFNIFFHQASNIENCGNSFILFLRKNKISFSETKKKVFLIINKYF